MEEKKETTGIRISIEVKKFIESKGKYGDSHDKILRRLLKINECTDNINNTSLEVEDGFK